MKGLNVALAIAFHCLVGVVFLVTTQFSEFSEARLSVAALLWFGGLFVILNARDRSPGGIWLVPVVWPFAAWYTALGVLVLIGWLIWLATRFGSPAPGLASAAPAHEADSRAAKLRALESTLATLEAQLRDLLEAAPVAPTPAPAAGPALPAYARRQTTTPPPQQPKKSPLEREITWSDLLGARTLAWAGGVVTVL
jgi:hypothetical protein